MSFNSSLQGDSRSGIKKNQDRILDIFSDVLQPDGNSLVPKSIERACLENAEVLSQVDKKFIAIVAGKNLAIIDQVVAFSRTFVEHFSSRSDVFWVSVCAERVCIFFPFFSNIYFFILMFLFFFFPCKHCLSPVAFTMLVKFQKIMM